LVSGLSDERVAQLLEDYYQRVQDILGDQLQEYDYYMDWIADELFVVVYSRQTDQVDLVARQKMAICVLDLSQKILLMKDKFAQDQKLVLAVDIGLSSGQSLIGVIGPTNHRKATALGSNPGRARRMQGCGKLMRNEISEQDRIIFGDEMYIVLQAPEEFTMSINYFDATQRRLRNMEDQKLFYVIVKNVMIINVYMLIHLMNIKFQNVLEELNVKNIVVLLNTQMKNLIKKKLIWMLILKRLYLK
jgi:class 3 adenylate cyclase